MDLINSPSLIENAFTGNSQMRCMLSTGCSANLFLWCDWGCTVYMIVLALCRVLDRAPGPAACYECYLSCSLDIVQEIKRSSRNFSSFTNQVCDRVSNLVNKLMCNDTGHSLFVDWGGLVLIEQQVSFSVSDQAPVLHRSCPKVWDRYFICNRDRIHPMFFHHNNHCIDRQDMNQLIRC